VKKVNTARYTSWKEGIINIYDLSMEDLVKRLEKRYNQPFELTPEVKELRYTFTIENEPLEDVLKLMERITPVKVKQTDETIKIEIDRKKLKEVGR
jgi:ferric-dicitrate binding protein FerR (iron transport regulator)